MQYDQKGLFYNILKKHLKMFKCPVKVEFQTVIKSASRKKLFHYAVRRSSGTFAIFIFGPGVFNIAAKLRSAFFRRSFTKQLDELFPFFNGQVPGGIQHIRKSGFFHGLSSYHFLKYYFRIMAYKSM